jgi:hypothetical protein
MPAMRSLETPRFASHILGILVLTFGENHDISLKRRMCCVGKNLNLPFGVVLHYAVDVVACLGYIAAGNGWFYGNRPP